MANEPELLDVDAAFSPGARSNAHPGNLGPGYYFNAVNLVNLGGVLQTRPGQNCLVTFPDGNLQGAALFRPKIGLEQIVAVVDGIAYAADYPFKEFHNILGISLSPDAKQVFFCLAEQSVKRVNQTTTSAITFITPKNVLILQDNLTAPAWYDGSQAGHDTEPLGIPIGGPMAWVGNRLWVANGALLYAGDIANPFSFRESFYPGNLRSLVFASEVTALAPTPSLEFSQLLVWTETNTNLIRADIQTRSDWTNTPGFQRSICDVGCLSHRSVTPLYGLLWWFAPSGWTSLDVAAASKISARLPARDLEMTVSKRGVSGDLSLIAGASHGNFLLVSVPHEDNYNTHTWVLDAAAEEIINGASPTSWCGVWTGTRPVQWIYGVIAGQSRIYHVSVDKDGKNRLWECFQPERADNGCPISWMVETRGYFGPAAPIQYNPMRDKKLCFADLGLEELQGSVDIAAWWAGSSRGAYKRCMVKAIQATEGSFAPDVPVNQDTIIFGLKPQSRDLRTTDVRASAESAVSSCGVEAEGVEYIDKSFQLLIAGSGAAAIHYIRAWAQVTANESPSGKCERDETDFRAVGFDGSAAKDEDFSVAVAAISQAPELFESSQSFTATSGEFSYTGTGYAVSIVSQADADKIALVIATKTAELGLSALLPEIISDGDHYEDDI